MAIAPLDDDKRELKADIAVVLMAGAGITCFVAAFHINRAHPAITVELITIGMGAMYLAAQMLGGVEPLPVHPPEPSAPHPGPTPFP